MTRTEAVKDLTMTHRRADSCFRVGVSDNLLPGSPKRQMNQVMKPVRDVAVPPWLRHHALNPACVYRVGGNRYLYD